MTKEQKENAILIKSIELKRIILSRLKNFTPEYFKIFTECFCHNTEPQALERYRDSMYDRIKDILDVAQELMCVVNFKDESKYKLPFRNENRPPHCRNHPRLQLEEIENEIEQTYKVLNQLLELKYVEEK